MISIHALREEGDRFCADDIPLYKISIHALREEGDLVYLSFCVLLVVISIHALREEGDLGQNMAGQVLFVFLSTPSARRATYASSQRTGSKMISIHALREEGDAVVKRPLQALVQFLSTPSARRATSSREPPQQVTGDFYPRPPRGGRHLPAGA